MPDHLPVGTVIDHRLLSLRMVSGGVLEMVRQILMIIGLITVVRAWRKFSRRQVTGDHTSRF
jgi:hypothetical protein